LLVLPLRLHHLRFPYPTATRATSPKHPPAAMGRSRCGIRGTGNSTLPPLCGRPLFARLHSPPLLWSCTPSTALLFRAHDVPFLHLARHHPAAGRTVSMHHRTTECYLPVRAPKHHAAYAAALPTRVSPHCAPTQPGVTGNISFAPRRLPLRLTGAFNAVPGIAPTAFLCRHLLDDRLRPRPAASPCLLLPIPLLLPSSLTVSYYCVSLVCERRPPRLIRTIAQPCPRPA